MTPAFLKLPFILTSLLAFQATTTPPNPPPRPDETVTSTKLEVVVKQRIGILLVQTIFWLASLAEAATILASQNPQSACSQRILKLLVLSHTAEDIRVRPTVTFFLGVILICFGSYIRWSCFRALGRMFTFEMSIRKDHQLIRDGFYSMVRHPAYTGVLLTQAGIMCWHATPGSWVMQSGILETTFGKLLGLVYVALVSTITIGLLFRMSREDAILKKTFKEEWDVWAKEVPYKLVPGLL
ncbi:hypothetical protein D9613_000510 [Agrocybe pediades]|uniref:Protein-S-isoprenylcysteine O-methyltransferase n=1 Tax=Agrocybe pediades TaxID=84607 RepID=A0A8H4R110_9AGAR|nr:hypothetical protein D9613_000510 [Agrocybe pediades]